MKHPPYLPDPVPYISFFWLFHYIKDRFDSCKEEKSLNRSITKIISSINKKEWIKTFDKHACSYVFLLRDIILYIYWNKVKKIMISSFFIPYSHYLRMVLKPGNGTYRCGRKSTENGRKNWINFFCINPVKKFFFHGKKTKKIFKLNMKNILKKLFNHLIKCLYIYLKVLVMGPYHIIKKTIMRPGPIMLYRLKLPANHYKKGPEPKAK